MFNLGSFVLENCIIMIEWALVAITLLGPLACGDVWEGVTGKLILVLPIVTSLVEKCLCTVLSCVQIMRI